MITRSRRGRGEREDADGRGFERRIRSRVVAMDVSALSALTHICISRTVRTVR